MKLKLFGTEIYISFLFSAIIAFSLAIDRSGLILPTFGAVLLHEIGHLIALKCVGCAPTAIRLIPSSVQLVRPFCRKPKDELLIAVCGPFGNFLCSILSAALWQYTDGYRLLRFALINLILGLFNLLPIAGLDGGSILLWFLERRCSAEKAVLILRVISFLFAIGSFAAGILLVTQNRFNPSFFFLALYFLLTALLKI